MNTFIQLLEEAQQNNSGFSFNPTQVNPTQGYMVSINGYEMGCGKAVLMNFGIRYYQEHQEMMALNPSLYIGCWFQNDMFYFDISQNVHPINVAMAMAENNMQLAIWDCANQEEIRTTLRQCACCGKRSSHGYVFNQGEDYTCDDINCRDHVSNNMYGAEWDELCEYEDSDEEMQVSDSFYYTEHAADV